MGDGVSEWFPKQFCASTILDSRFRGNDWQECHSPLDGESTRLLRRALFVSAKSAAKTDRHDEKTGKTRPNIGAGRLFAGLQANRPRRSHF